MEEQTPTRQEIRAVLADPESTPRQILEAKLILLKRMTGHENKIRQICARYRLTPEQTKGMLARYHTASVTIEAWAVEQMRRVEEALTEQGDE